MLIGLLKCQGKTKQLFSHFLFFFQMRPLLKTDHIAKSGITLILSALPVQKHQGPCSSTGKIQGLTGRKRKEGNDSSNTVTTNFAKQPLPGCCNMIFHQGKRTLDEMSRHTLTVTG